MDGMTFRYHIGRQNVVIQQMEPFSQKKLVVGFVQLLRAQYPKITWHDIEDVALEPKDIAAYIDASPLKAFEQPKKKQRK